MNGESVFTTAEQDEVLALVREQEVARRQEEKRQHQAWERQIEQTYGSMAAYRAEMQKRIGPRWDMTPRQWEIFSTIPFNKVEQAMFDGYRS